MKKRKVIKVDELNQLGFQVGNFCLTLEGKKPRQGNKARWVPSYSAIGYDMNRG